MAKPSSSPTPKYGLAIPGSSNAKCSTQSMPVGIQTDVQAFCPWKEHGEMAPTIDYQFPQCSQLKEDKAHIIQCQHEAAIAKWNAALQQLREWMQAEQSDPQLIALLIMELHAWQNSELHTNTSPLVQKQLELGGCSP